MIQTYYRLGRGTTDVPEEAPRLLCWRSLDNAIRDISAWVFENPLKQRGGCGDHEFSWCGGPSFEYRVVEICLLPPNMREGGNEGASGNGVYVARVRARIYVERRQYKTIREPLEAVVDGVTLRGMGPERRVYVGEWFTGWYSQKKRWHEGYRAYIEVSIPIVRDEIRWADKEGT